MTKFEEIERIWHKFNKVFITVHHTMAFDARHALEDELSTLCDGDIVFGIIADGREDTAVIGGCIVLMEDMSDD